MHRTGGQPDSCLHESPFVYAFKPRTTTLVRVIVDERERPSGVPDELARIGATVSYQVLDVADYVVREYAIERKSSRDFVSSLFSGRLFDQANRLTQAYETPLLVI